MSDLKESIQQYITSLEYCLKFDYFTDKSLNEWFRPLVASFTEDGAIPYLLSDGMGERFRASPLASTLVWMCSAGLLPNEAIDILQKKLLFLRDSCEKDDKSVGNIKKKEGDEDGWSLAEGVSVWSTSMALIALMDDMGVGLLKADSYKKSILWLAKQQKNGENGWGYQQIENCEENAIMTALVMRVVATALIEKDSFNFDDDDMHLLHSALKNGFQYIKDNIKYSKNKKEVYWCFREEKHCAATIWTLMALKKIKQLSLSTDMIDFYEKNVSKGIEFVLNYIPSKCEKWEDELIVCEAGAKYNKQKNYYSFSPTLLLNLFEIGVSPFHPKVILQMRWLVNNEDKWKIESYDKNQICSFTYAMVISTIAKWRMLVGQDNAIRLLKEPDNRKELILQKIIGMPVFKDSVVQLVRTSRLLFCWGISLVFLILLIERKHIYSYIVMAVEYVLKLILNSQGTIMVNVISSAIYALIFFIVTVFLGLLIRIIRRIR